MGKNLSPHLFFLPFPFLAQAMTHESETNEVHALQEIVDRQQGQMGALAWIQALAWIENSDTNSYTVDINFEQRATRMRLFLSAIAEDPDGSKIDRDYQDTGCVNDPFPPHSVVFAFFNYASNAVDETKFNRQDSRWNTFFGELAPQLRALVKPSTGSTCWLHSLSRAQTLHRLPNFYTPILQATPFECFRRYDSNGSTAWGVFCGQVALVQTREGLLDVWAHTFFDACRNAHETLDDTSLLDADDNTDYSERTPLLRAIATCNLAAVRCSLLWASARIACIAEISQADVQARESLKDLPPNGPLNAHRQHIAKLVYMAAVYSDKTLEQVERVLCEQTSLIPPLVHLVRGYLDGAK
jgi:hypothetical protein